MAITRWRPFRDVVSVQDEMSRLFDDVFGQRLARVQWTDGVWNPSVDVTEDKDSVVVRAEMPGLNKDDVKISVQDSILTLKGEKKQEKEEKETDYHRIERSYGSFCRSFQLPTTVRADKIKANYKDGVLSIILPKTEEVKPKEIPIGIG
ncbi:MAG: Hsp20/alpha crystallin family protein [Candidatus Zixiibacteriota bacterium]